MRYIIFSCVKSHCDLFCELFFYIPCASSFILFRSLLKFFVYSKKLTISAMSCHYFFTSCYLYFDFACIFIVFIFKTLKLQKLSLSFMLPRSYHVLQKVIPVPDDKIILPCFLLRDFRLLVFTFQYCSLWNLCHTLEDVDLSFGSCSDA